jgi:hypothetical protein
MKRISFFALVLLLFTASNVLGQKVAVDWDHDADFSKYKTYAWIESQNPGSKLAVKRIVAAIESQLAARGLQKAQGGEADLGVVYNVGAKERVSPGIQLWLRPLSLGRRNREIRHYHVHRSDRGGEPCGCESS